MRPRRHVPTSRPRVGPRPWRRLLRDVGLVAAVFVVGYVISVLWISPTPPLGSSSHSVPRVIGLTETEARDQLTALGFRPRVNGTRPHPTLRAGVVIWQDPPPNIVLAPNGAVTLVLSAGAAPVPVPDVIGLDTATARRILTAAGVTVGDVSVIAGGPEPGIVVATRPAIGTTRPRAAAVGLVVSRGPEENP